SPLVGEGKGGGDRRTSAIGAPPNPSPSPPGGGEYARRSPEAPMVERRRFGNFFPYLVLSIGVFIVAFPVYLCFVGSTHPQALVANGQMPLTPGPLFFETYYKTLFVGTSGTTREPVSQMLFNSLVMATIIAVGKIAISILSAYAVVYFKFPFRMTAFWLIFMTLMLPVEVRIYPTYKIAAD